MFLKEFLEKVNFEKSQQHEKLPSMLMVYTQIDDYLFSYLSIFVLFIKTTVNVFMEKRSLFPQKFSQMFIEVFITYTLNPFGVH